MKLDRETTCSGDRLSSRQASTHQGFTGVRLDESPVRARPAVSSFLFTHHATFPAPSRSLGVPRTSRNRNWAQRLPANRLHHVTNRGVGRLIIFKLPNDHFVFLAILACVRLG